MSFDAYHRLSDSVNEDATTCAGVSNGVLRTEFIDFTEYHFDSRDNPEITLTPSQFQAKKDIGKYEDYALLVRRRKRCLKPGQYEYLSTWLEVRDEVLQKALGKVLAPIKYLGLASTPLIVKQPFRELFWYREEIKQYKELNCKDDEEEKSYGLLSTFMEQHLDQPLKIYDRLISRRIVDYKNIWMIFRPGSIAISVDEGRIQAFLVTSFQDPPNNSIPERPATIKGLMWGCDSDAFGPSERTVNLENFSGTRDILELPLYPLDFLPEKDREALLQRLIQRGRKWQSLINLCHKCYKGVGWEVSRRDSEETRMDRYLGGRGSEITSYHRTQRQVNGRIVLDHTTAMECNPGSAHDLLTGLHLAQPRIKTELEVPSFKDLGLSKIYKKYRRDSSYNVSNEEALLCPSTVRGYSLKDKCWVDFNVETVQDIEWDEACLPKLQINPTTRNFLACLVSKHAEAGHQMKDVIDEKGKGITFLFHGPPGCGKSLTAEVLAEHTKMPLLRITSGDLGTKAGEAEKKIQEAFRLASAWKAIILLDEADVFLAKRKTGDIGRNAFVTIFLTSMEYYAGTLMLTTNQPDVFDEAVQSRIHLQIAYPPLNGDQRKAVWRNVVQDQGIEHDLDEGAFARLGEKFVRNGREIKNLIQLAILSAQSGELPLNEEIITNICSMDCRHISQ